MRRRSGVAKVVAVAALLGGCALLRPLRPLEPKRLDPWPVQAAKGLAYVPAAAGLLAVEAVAFTAALGVFVCVGAAVQRGAEVQADDALRGGAAPMETRSPVF
jgi:hypothetical protein